MTGKPPQPCLSLPINLVDSAHPALTGKLRYFTMSEADLQKVDYPYATKTSDWDNSQHVIHYNEFRAHFGPNYDFGHPGDVWIDVNPHNYGLYARSKNKWMKWPVSTGEITSIVHPHLPVFLRCTETGVAWTHETLSSNSTIDQTEESARDIICKFLAREAETEASIQNEKKLVAERSSGDDQAHTSEASPQVEPEQAVSDTPLLTYRKLINID